MDDISNIINFDINENHPILASLKVNDNDILNESVERSAAESVTFVHSNPLAEKKVLASVNNNFKNEEPNINFACGEVSTGFTTNNFKENVAILSSEDIISEVENINSSGLVNETAMSVKTSNCVSFNSEPNNSGCGNDFESDSYNKSTYPCLEEIPAGNVNFLPDVLSNEDVSGNCENLSDNIVQYKKMSIPEVESIDCISTCGEELEHGKNNSYGIIPDLVDFSFREKENVTDDLLGNFPRINSVPKQNESFSNGTLEEFYFNTTDVRLQENKPASTSAELLESEYAKKEPTSPATNHLKETALADATENYIIVLGDTKSDEFPCKLSDNVGKEAVSTAIDNTPEELEKSNEITDGISVFDSGELDVSTNNEFKEVNSGVATFQEPKYNFVNESDEISPLKVERVSFDMFDKPKEKVSDSLANDECREVKSDNTGEAFPSDIEKASSDIPDKPLEHLADPDFVFKMPEVPSNNPVEQFSDPDFVFKMPEVPSNNPVEQFSDPDFVFKMPEVPSNNPVEQFSDPDFVFKVPEILSNNLFRNPDVGLKIQENPLTNENDEQFVDAVQFFKDANSFQFLENIKTSTIQSGSPVPRSSLYVNFDPLHSKFQNALKQDNCALINATVQESNASEKCSPELVHKHLVDVATRESLGNNILISFDSPKVSTCMDSQIPIQPPSAPKMITEEEHQQKLKIHELETQEVYLKKQKEMEMQIAKRDELLVIQRMIIEELSRISTKLSEEIRKGNEKIMSVEAENEKLKEDLKTSSEDLQSVENTFTDFYKRYEQCKGMLKSFKDNEEQLKQTILDLQAKEKEQEQVYSLLKERSEEMLEKANVEMDNLKRSNEAQLTVLKAQLKKAEMKISSLESDNKQIKIENSQLGGICDDLMAKVSRS